MAKLYNSLVGGKVTRINDMFTNRPVEVGYTHLRCTNPDLTSGMLLAFHSNVDGERDYTVALDPLDVQRVINRLLNPNYNIGFFGSASGSPSDRSDFHYEELLLANGIKLTTWRYPAQPFANGTERWYWVRAVNRYHAEHQFASLIKSFNPKLVEEHNEE